MKAVYFSIITQLCYFSVKCYHIQAVTPVDMFPCTAHVETVVLLSRKDVHERIKFDVNIEELMR